MLDPFLCKTHRVDATKVVKYVKSLERGARFPEIEVVLIKGAYLVLDGAHRTHAHRELNEPILAFVYDKDDCPKRFLLGFRGF